MGVQVCGPGVYAAGQVGDLAIAPRGQEQGHLLAAPAVVAHDHIGMAGIQFPKAVRYLAHGDMQRTLYMDMGVLGGFPYIQQDASGTALGQERPGVSRGDLRYTRHVRT